MQALRLIKVFTLALCVLSLGFGCTQSTESSKKKGLLDEKELREQSSSLELSRKDNVERRVAEKIEAIQVYLERIGVVEASSEEKGRELKAYKSDLKRIQNNLKELRTSMKEEISPQTKERLNLAEEELIQIEEELEEWNKNNEQEWN